MLEQTEEAEGANQVPNQAKHLMGINFVILLITSYVGSNNFLIANNVCVMNLKTSNLHFFYYQHKWNCRNGIWKLKRCQPKQQQNSHLFQQEEGRYTTICYLRCRILIALSGIIMTYIFLFVCYFHIYYNTDKIQHKEKKQRKVNKFKCKTKHNRNGKGERS